MKQRDTHFMIEEAFKFESSGRNTTFAGDGKMSGHLTYDGRVLQSDTLRQTLNIQKKTSE